MTGSDWGGPITRQHTFETGRIATLRVAVSITQLQRSGVWSDEVEAAWAGVVADSGPGREIPVPLMDALLIGMFVKPRVIPDPPPGEAVPDGCQAISDLEEQEVLETITAALGGSAFDASFPGVSDDGDGDVGSVDVAGVAVESARDGAGVDSGPRRRRSSSKSAA